MAAIRHNDKSREEIPPMKSRLAARPLAAAVALALVPAAPALAMQFEFDNGIRANLDTTVS
jgi:hypothetical protein